MKRTDEQERDAIIRALAKFRRCENVPCGMCWNRCSCKPCGKCLYCRANKLVRKDKK